MIRDECLAVRERVGILDLSGFAKYDLTGADAETFLNRVCANRVAVKPGGIILAHVLSEAGRIQAEMTITRLAAERFYVLSAAGAELRDLDFLTQGRMPDEQVTINNVTNDRGVLVLAGPKSRDLLRTLTDTPLHSDVFPWLTGREIRVAGKSVRALRVNYVGELGWELHAAMADMKVIYDALWEAGQEFAVANFGLYAVNSLRMEKAYRGWGAELTNEVTMLDAAMDRFIRFDKDDFIGKQATLEQAEQGLSWKLVYFEIDASDSDVRGGEPVFDGDLCIGVTTSGGYGHYVQKSLGFAYVDIAYAGAGTCFDIDLLGDRCSAEVLAEPVYDPGNHNLRA